jgi:enoyl-CoA hydratase
MEFNTLLFTIDNSIATITINRPDKMNALNKDVIADLSKAFDEVYQNNSIKSVILTGSGQKAFVLPSL